MDEKFPQIPRDPEDKIDDGGEAQSELNEPSGPSANVIPPPYLRFAYGIFFLVQLSVQIVYPLPLARCSHFSPGQVAPASLGLIYFLSRKQPLSTQPGRNLIILFLLHGIGLLLIALYERIYLRDRIWEGKLLQVMIFLKLFWVICGTVAVRKIALLAVF